MPGDVVEVFMLCLSFAVFGYGVRWLRELGRERERLRDAEIKDFDTWAARRVSRDANRRSMLN